MGKLVYTAITSLDGYIEDADGSFAWAEPDPEVHAFANELERGVGTHLYGRRMYETMAVWETVGSGPDVSPEEVEYAEVWRALDKVVYSTTLTDVWTSQSPRRTPASAPASHPRPARGGARAAPRRSPGPRRRAAAARRSTGA